MPLLEYAQFAELLRAGRALAFVDLDDATIKELNSVRKRAAHSGDVLVESRTDGDQAPGTVARETPLWQAWIQERFPMPPEPGKSE